MSTTPTTPTPRGAGSGDKANATRGRNIVDWPPEPKPHSEKIDELEAESDAQAEYNAAMADLQMKQLEAVKDKLAFPQGEDDPDKAREAAKEAFENANDPKKKEARLKGEMEARAKRDKEAAAK